MDESGDKDILCKDVGEGSDERGEDGDDDDGGLENGYPNRQTNEWTLVIVESLLQLQNFILTMQRLEM